MSDWLWRTDFEEAKRREAVFLRNKWSGYSVLCVWNGELEMWITLDQNSEMRCENLSYEWFAKPTGWAEAPFLEE